MIFRIIICKQYVFLASYRITEYFPYIFFFLISSELYHGNICLPSRQSLNFKFEHFIQTKLCSQWICFCESKCKNNFPSYFALLWDFLEPESVWASGTVHKFSSDTFNLTFPLGASSLNKHLLSLPRAYTFDFQSASFQSH